MIDAVLDSLWFAFTRIVPAVVLGVALANVLVEFGLMRYVSAATRPVTRGANLPDEAGGAVLTCLASPAAGYSMLADYRGKGSLSDRQTLIAVVINTFPGSTSHLFTYYIPVVIPILGLEAGAMYVGARLGISLAITLTGLVAGRALLERPERFAAALEPDGRDRGEQVMDGLRNSYSLLRKILVRLVAAYVLVSVLAAYGALDSVVRYAEPVTGSLGLAPGVAAVVAARVLDTTSSFVVASSLMGSGDLVAAEAVVALLVGGLVSLTVHTFKSSIPFQFSVWGPEFGTRVVALNLALKLFFLGAFVSVILTLR